MTLGGWILFGFLAVSIVGIALLVIWMNNFHTKEILITVVVSIALIIGLLAGMLTWYRNTESGKRALKSWHSETHEGISRTVRVYDIEGDLIQEYSGKFDVDYDDDRIIFDDQDGKRHVIYYPTGTVIIDEN